MRTKAKPWSWLAATAIVVLAMSWIPAHQTILSSGGRTVETVQYGLPVPWLIHDSTTGWSFSFLSFLATFGICFSAVAIVSLLSNTLKSNRTREDVPTTESNATSG